MKAKTIIIIGGALAGPVAAARAREYDEYAKIILLERNTRVGYAMTGLTFHLSGEVSNLEDLNKERADFFKNIYNIETYTQTEVLEIKRKLKSVLLVHAGKQELLKYDKLIFAAGAASVHPEKLPNVTNFRYFRTLDDLKDIRSCLEAGKRKFTILGGGSMGFEAADGLIRAGADVTILEKSEFILSEFGENISVTIRKRLEEKANIITNAKEIKFEVTENILKSVNVNGQTIETDFLICAIGVTPRTELLKKAGIKLLRDGSVPIDSNCRTNDKNIIATSICVTVPTTFGNKWITQAAVSDKTAQIAGANAAGANFKTGKFTNSMLLRLPGFETGRTGMNEFEAISAVGKKHLGKVFIHSANIESYMPGSSEIILEILFHKKTGKLLGLSAVGQNLKSRIDSFSAALTGKLGIQDLSQMDFAYTPAFGTARDALNIAATVAMQLKNGTTKTIEAMEVKRNRSAYFLLDTSNSTIAETELNMNMPLENLRSGIQKVKDAYLRSGTKSIAVISDTGRRGHLSLRILLQAGLPAANISGGRRLYSILKNNK